MYSFQWYEIIFFIFSGIAIVFAGLNICFPDLFFPKSLPNFIVLKILESDVNSTRWQRCFLNSNPYDFETYWVYNNVYYLSYTGRLAIYTKLNSTGDYKCLVECSKEEERQLEQYFNKLEKAHKLRQINRDSQQLNNIYSFKT